MNWNQVASLDYKVVVVNDPEYAYLTYELLFKYNQNYRWKIYTLIARIYKL